jgi:hypothetical protein
MDSFWSVYWWFFSQYQIAWHASYFFLLVRFKVEFTILKNDLTAICVQLLRDLDPKRPNVLDECFDLFLNLICVQSLVRYLFG